MLTEGTYKNLEFVIVENNSTEQATWDYYEKIQKEFPNVHVVRWEREFNYSAINNFGAQHAKGEYLLFDRKEFRGRDAWLCPERGRGDRRSEIAL